MFKHRRWNTGFFVCVIFHGGRILLLGMKDGTNEGEDDAAGQETDIVSTYLAVLWKQK